MSNSKKKKKNTIYVSQKVVISSIFDKSLINKNTKAILPEKISDIYNEMMADVSYINETLTRKDYSFYDCNMGFLDGEAMISAKRRGLVEFMSKRENKVRESDVLKKKTLTTKSVKKSSKKSMTPKNCMDLCDSTGVKKKLTNQILGNEHIDLQKEIKHISGGKTELPRSQRKRKAPLKFKREESSQPKRNITSHGEINSEADDSIELKMVLSKPFKSVKLRKSKEVINLVTEDSSDGDSDHQRTSGGCDKIISGKSDQKTKVYFREPLTRKPTKLSNKKLKEHTLLDKILLGINCVRKWTDKGLHLSRLCETDLFMLNKRLSSLNCMLSDLEEHTDENKNRYLSVLLQSDLFSAFIVSVPPSLQTSVLVAPSHQKSDHESNAPNAPTAPTAKELNDQSQLDSDHNNNNVNYSRQKSKLHVPVMYRQRHGVPSILSKPTTIRPQLNDKRSTSRELSNLNSYNPEETPFSIIKLEENFQVSHSAIQTESAPTASQLLRLKFQKSNLDQANQMNITKIAPEVSSATSINSPGTQLSQYTIPNGIPLNGANSFIVQTASQQYPIPLIVLPPNSTLMPQMSNGNRRPIHIPLSKPFHTVTKIQRIPLNGNGVQHLTTNSSQIRITSGNERNNSLSSKSVILKNLLQQSSTRMKSSQLAVSTSEMVPRSVFQSSHPKRPFVSFNHHQSLKR